MIPQEAVEDRLDLTRIHMPCLAAFDPEARVEQCPVHPLDEAVRCALQGARHPPGWETSVGKLPLQPKALGVAPGGDA